MFRVSHHLSALATSGIAAALLFTAPAAAADVEYDDAPHARRYDPPRYDPPPPYGGPQYGRPPYAVPAPPRERWGHAEECRVIYRRGVDAYGREIVRRLRVCDEGVVERRGAWAERPRYYEGAPEGYRAPRPPRGVGPDDDED